MFAPFILLARDALAIEFSAMTGGSDEGSPEQDQSHEDDFSKEATLFSDIADLAEGSLVADWINAGAGNDQVSMFGGTAWADLGAGDDIAIMGSGADQLFGGEGCNVLDNTLGNH